MYVSKSTAYMISGIGFIFFLVPFYFNSSYFKAGIENRLTLVALFLSFSFMSFLGSITTYRDIVYGAYLIYPIAISAAFLFFYTVTPKQISKVKLHRSIASVALILFGFACLQQVGITKLPGETLTFTDKIRPSSTTGSYLHYPLFMALLAAVLISIKKRVEFASMICLASVFIAFSRSGMMLVVLSFLFLAFYSFLKKRITFDKSEVILGFCILVTLTLILYLGFFDLIIERMISSISLQSPGNDIRLEAWKRGLEIFASTNLLIGEHFGKVTNLTANLAEAESTVVESGFIQNLINFGLLGTIAFYSLFAYVYRDSTKIVEKCFMLAFFAQTFVYQSIEVFPYIIGLLFLFSLTARSKAVLHIKF